ncbi:MAG TPA: hypothetical protein VE871_01345 [Longimicrobium sp.]|nr:hypothetical protein [Longimicrobium sp.]
MSIPIRRPLAVLASAAAFGATALPAHAQGAEPETFCIAGRPLPSCGYFFVATGSFYPRIGGSSYTRDFDVEGRPVRLEFPEMDGHYDLEVGVLANRSADAVGAAVSVGLDGDTGLRLAVKGRYRRWLGRYVALDAGAGVLRAQMDPEPTHRIESPYGYGLTGDVTFGLTDWVALSGRGDIVWSEGQSAHALYGGVRLGSIPTLFTGILAAVVVAAVGDEIGG